MWSTGVILYTLLIGKPPFESKDVKSTYKRIVANQYSFPDHTPVCDHAKNLIRHMLQHRPEKRPDLDQILNHSFFTRPAAYTPRTLPESALREMPPAASTQEMQTYAQHVNGGQTSGVKRGSDIAYGIDKGYEKQAAVSDENDPHAINRQAYTSKNEVPAKAGLGSRPFSALNINGQQAAQGNTQHPINNINSQGVTGASASSRPRSAGMKQEKDNLAPLQVQRRGSNGSNSQGGQGFEPYCSSNQGKNQSAGMSTTQGMSGDTVRSGSGNNYVLNPPRGAHTRSGQSSQQQQQGRGYSAKFDIYTDAKNSKNLPPAPLSSRSTSSGATTREARSDSIGNAGEAMNIDQIQTELDGVHIGRGQQGQQTTEESASLASLAAGNPQPVRAANSKPSEAWTWDDQNNEDVFSVKIAQPKAPSPQRAASTKISATFTNTNNDNNGNQGKSDREIDEPDNVSTPAQAIGYPNKPLDTLETMHNMLNRPYNGLEGEQGTSMHQRSSPERQDLVATSQVSPERWANAVGTLSEESSVNKLIARVWVVRYVDYTSKYGLGFLLNTGSAGVYFNDSTKIVLSADGLIFQYIERRRKDGQVNSEHISQTHSMSAYPLELQKKVTLLRHFRNYLVDQQKTYGQGNQDGSGQDSALESVSSLPMVLPEGASTGADGSIPFGTSSAHFDADGAVEMGSVTMSNCAHMTPGSRSAETDMPFLKKWVRTRHAILFRLSNRIVQVVFFDRSEVLLSSEARVVTYVNKQGHREDHSLEDVLHTGRTDIAKRLKYTKDIMHRLINVAK